MKLIKRRIDRVRDARVRAEEIYTWRRKERGAVPKRIEDVDTHVAAYTQHNKQNEKRASGAACRPLMETKKKKRDKGTDPSPQKKKKRSFFSPLIWACGARSVVTVLRFEMGENTRLGTKRKSEKGWGRKGGGGRQKNVQMLAVREHDRNCICPCARDGAGLLLLLLLEVLLQQIISSHAEPPSPAPIGAGGRLV